MNNLSLRGLVLYYLCAGETGNKVLHTNYKSTCLWAVDNFLAGRMLAAQLPDRSTQAAHPRPGVLRTSPTAAATYCLAFIYRLS